jgi:uncharacterized protein (DUF1697 family)
MNMVCLHRGVNIGAHHRIRMEALRAVYELLGLRNARTLLQSGNGVFVAPKGSVERLAAKIENAFEHQFGFRSAVLLRTEAEMRTIVEENPFAQRQGLDFSKLAVFFLPGKITPDSRTALQAIRSAPDEFYAGERELFVYYPNGFSKAVLTQGMLDRALNGVKGTARNWNTVLKLLAMAGEEAAAKP